MTERQRMLILDNLKGMATQDDNLMQVILSKFNMQDTIEKIEFYLSVMEGNNAWVSDKAREFLFAVLVPIVVLRDLQMLVPASDIHLVKDLESLKEIQHVNISAELLYGYLNVEAMRELANAFQALLKDVRFVCMLDDSEHGGDFDYSNAYIRLLSIILEAHGVDCKSDLPIDDGNLKYFRYGTSPWELLLKHSIA